MRELALVFVLLFCGSIGALAQSANIGAQSTGELPADPGTPAPVADSAPQFPTHAFWDKENILLFSGVAIFRALDYTSTKNMLARGRGEILLPDDVVDNSAGFAAVEAAATATSIGISYVLHRTGHHKLERWLSITHLSVTAFGAARNYALKSYHPGTNFRGI
ncbi:MAG TPA: hypothetical protein VN684_12715 [Terriglobales bacterium]|nr:hypothetical protein [Terriglobales bacterium]